MVSSKVILVLAFVCVALVPAYAAVTKCLVCESTTTSKNEKCLAGETTASTCTPTTSTFTHCFKEILNEGETNESVKRGCTTDRSAYTCPDKAVCEFCEEDECNSSITISQSIPIIGLSVVAAFLLSRFNH